MIAPEPILRAVNETIAWACIYCRNQTTSDPADREMLYQMMDAIHEVPRMVLNWERHDLRQIRTYFGCFPSSRWPGAPDLVLYFNERLREYQEAVWDQVRQHLQTARSMLRPPVSESPSLGSIENFENLLEHNELELALDEIEGVGEQNSPPSQFWRALSLAAAAMGLDDRAASLDKRAA